MTNHPWNGRGQVTRSSLNFKARSHISWITEAKIVKFLTHVDYIKCHQKDHIQPLNGHGYGHVTVFKFCHLPWCSALQGFVSNSWSLFYMLVPFLSPNQQCHSTVGNTQHWLQPVVWPHHSLVPTKLLRQGNCFYVGFSDASTMVNE